MQGYIEDTRICVEYLLSSITMMNILTEVQRNTTISDEKNNNNLLETSYNIWFNSKVVGEVFHFCASRIAKWNRKKLWLL